MQSLVSKDKLEVMQPELNAKPRVYYKNLWRYTTAFIAGTLSAEVNGRIDCVEGASVKLMKDGTLVSEAFSDNYGDFKFDRLAEGSGAYSVEIETEGRPKKIVETKLERSISLGEIRLG